ncbi:MAG: Vitamin B12 dependent methionine synthase activation subunit [Clostridia bacterium]|nr:Vitamin B12 dependent methionine synthase activation subunit [Clostridia bacterium]
MNPIIYLENNFTLPEVDRREVLRYARTKEASPEVEQLLAECIAEVEKTQDPRVCFCFLPVFPTDGGVTLGDTDVLSENLKTALNPCENAVLFAATLGLGIDRLIAKYSRVSPAKALLIEAVSNERIEAVCDVFQQMIADRHGGCRPRFSPGYGDLPLAFQRDVFKFLDCPRKIGLTLNESLLMTPVKSVTALFGINKL